MMLTLLLVLQTGVTTGDPVFDLLTYGATFGTAAILGAVKRYTNVADSAIGKVTKPFQPIIALAAGILFPAFIHGTPNVPDPSAFSVAPTATIAAVVAAELLRRIIPARRL